MSLAFVFSVVSVVPAVSVGSRASVGFVILVLCGVSVLIFLFYLYCL